MGKSVCEAHDLAGNAWEWCLTKWLKNYEDYQRNVPHGRATESARVVRGGSWNLYADYARCACRDWYGPNLRYWDLGLRLVASPVFPLDSDVSEL